MTLYIPLGKASHLTKTSQWRRHTHSADFNRRHYKVTWKRQLMCDSSTIECNKLQTIIPSIKINLIILYSLSFFNVLVDILVTFLSQSHVFFQSQSHVWLFCEPTDSSLPGSSVHGISQARILEWVALSCSRGSSQSEDQIHASRIGSWILYHWFTREIPFVDIQLPF